METNITTSQQRDASLDSSKRVGLIILIAIIAVGAAWYYFVKKH